MNVLIFKHTFIDISVPRYYTRPVPKQTRETPARRQTVSRVVMSATEASAFGAETFAEGNWYHELLEDGLALSYRVRIDARARARARARDGETTGRW